MKKQLLYLTIMTMAATSGLSAMQKAATVGAGAAGEPKAAQAASVAACESKSAGAAQVESAGVEAIQDAAREAHLTETLKRLGLLVKNLKDPLAMLNSFIEAVQYQTEQDEAEKTAAQQALARQEAADLKTFKALEHELDNEIPQEERELIKAMWPLAERVRASLRRNPYYQEYLMEQSERLLKEQFSKLATQSGLSASNRRGRPTLVKTIYAMLVHSCNELSHRPVGFHYRIFPSSKDSDHIIQLQLSYDDAITPGVQRLLVKKYLGS